MSELQKSSVLQLPVLDLSQPVEPSFLLSLSQACQEWGFFYVTNHGVSKELFSKIYSLSKQVFSVPLEAKLKLGPSSDIKTYTPCFIASPYFESLVVSGPDFHGSAKASSDVLFDEKKSELSEIMQEYGSAMMDLSKRIIEVLLMTLGDGIEKKFYKSDFGNCHGYFRMVNYTPPVEVEKEEVEGLGMHTDMSCITILYQDAIGGLQMRSKEGKWMDICPCEKSLVVNIGDLMQAWSNGRLRSAEHRVVLRKLVNRISLAFFWCFQDDKVVLAPDEIVGAGNSGTYRSFVCSDYLRFRESYEVGKFEKIGYTVRDFAGLKRPYSDNQS